MLALSEWALVAGSVKGLLVEGFSEKGMDIISAYVDATADVQTASILTAKARCLYSSSGKGGTGGADLFFPSFFSFSETPVH